MTRAISIVVAILVILGIGAWYYTTATPKTMTLQEARAIALKDNECTQKGTVGENGTYNANSDTWWFDFTPKPEFAQAICNPACVVNAASGTAEINWRCTGFIQPTTTAQALVNTVTFTCDKAKTIKASFYQGSSTPARAGEMPTPNGRAELTLSDGRSLSLPQTISASGIRYANTDESFIFWSKGQTAFIEEKGAETYSNCITK